MLPDKIVVTGANGQIGSALINQLFDQVVGLGQDEMDLAKPDRIPKILGAIRPNAVINAAAYTQVDQAEEEEALATTINGEAPGAMARYCAEAGIPFIHYSTDYVFDGSGDQFRSEGDPVAPLNAYGRSKLAGERAVAEAGGHYLILRTSWVYDAYGKNFFNTMLRLGKTRETLSIVADQHGAPSYAPQLAEATVSVLGKALVMPEFPSGLYHFCHSGATTWHGFAEAIFDAARARSERIAVKDVAAIPSSAYPAPAKRPHNSRLDCSKLRDVFGVSFPTWEAGLAACIEETYGCS